MFIFLILVICVYLVSSFNSKKGKINIYGGKNPKIKVENMTRPKLPDDYMKKEAIIFNNMIKNIKKDKKCEEIDNE